MDIVTYVTFKQDFGTHGGTRRGGSREGTAAPRLASVYFHYCLETQGGLVTMERKGKREGSTAETSAAPVQKLSHALVELFRSKIASGELKPGDTLLPEAELLQQLHVSRPTLRQALRVLESESLIQLGRGA